MLVALAMLTATGSAVAGPVRPAPPRPDQRAGPVRTAPPGAPRDGDEPPDRATPAQSDPAAFMKRILGFSDLTGEVRAEKVTYWSFPPFVNLRSRLQIAADGDWHFANSTAEVCGGAMMNAKSVIDFDKGKKGIREFRVEADFAGLRLEEFTRHMKAPLTPGEVTGRAALRITSEGRQGLSGAARLRVRRGDLGRLPFMVKTLSFLTGSGFRKHPIEEADARITIAPRALVFEELVMRTRDGGFKILSERGGPSSGFISYDGKLDFYFRPRFTTEFLETLSRIPGGDIVVKVLAAFKERGGRVHVTGTPNDPKFKWAPFR